MNTNGIQLMIHSYTQGLDAERAKLRDLASGAIAVRDPQHAIEQAQMEVARLQGVIQGLTMAMVEIDAELEIVAQRAVVEDFEVVRTH